MLIKLTEENNMKVQERFLEYVKIPTSSDHRSTSVPTTSKQFVLANYLVDEMKKIGIADAYVDEMCYVYGHIPATKGYENVTKLGLIAHMDTSPDAADHPINPQIIDNYNGDDITLGDSGRVIDSVNFPHIKRLIGKTLITTDGKTLLGADDKAGIAEIMTVCEKIISGGISHGKISVCFTPDEEVGAGTDHFDLAVFDAELAYTVDGGEAGEVVYENFNAASADFVIYTPGWCEKSHG